MTKVVALDFDGTIATDEGVLCGSAERALPLYRNSFDIQVVVCTGRRLSYVEPYVRNFADAIVAENGGVIDWGDKIEIGETVTDNLRNLVKFHFPENQYEVRRTIVFIDCHPDNFPQEFTDEITSLGYSLVRNNSTAVVKPPEYQKSKGLQHAMSYRHNNTEVIAAGDSENDLDLLKMADHALVPENGDGILNATHVGEPFHRGDKKFFDGIEDKLHEIVSQS